MENETLAILIQLGLIKDTSELWFMAWTIPLYTPYQLHRDMLFVFLM